MSNGVKAIILAAGKSTRLRPFTNHKPKVMLEIDGKPILEYNLNIAKKARVRDIYINLYHAAENIRDYFGSGTKFGVNINYSREKNILGSAGAVKKIAKDFPRFKETFFVVYGDNFTNCNLSKLLKAHKKNKGIATIAIFDRTKNKNSGIAGGRVLYDKKTFKIKSFRETSSAESNFVNAGIYVAEPEILKYIPKDKFYDFGKDLFPLLIKKRIDIYAYLMPKNEYVFGIDTVECYKKAQNFWAGIKKQNK